MSLRIALVTQDLSIGGGTVAMTSFLYRVLLQSGRYEPEVISLATAAFDRASVRLGNPTTWRSGVRLERGTWRDLPYTHVGACISEVEFQRCRPRQALQAMLERYDLIQFVVGSPSLACAALDAGRPVLLWTATTTRADRTSRICRAPLPRRAWSQLMTHTAERLERRALREARVVFALSEYTRKALQPCVQSEKVTLAPCGVDTELFRPGASGTEPYILCVARLSDARKNIGLLLQAYARLRRSNPVLPDLYLVGEPPSAAAHRLLRDLGIADKVRLLGTRQGAELAALYRNAQFFVLSSDEEGLGIVILEAMASGLPVVSTDCGGPRDVVKEGETGFLTPVGDVESFTSAIGRLLSNRELRAAMGAAGRRLVEERFSIRAAAIPFLDAYDALLGIC